MIHYTDNNARLSVTVIVFIADNCLVLICAIIKSNLFIVQSSLSNIILSVYDLDHSQAKIKEY